MSTTKDKIKVMRAQFNGEKIEFMVNSTGDWCPTSNPIWDWSRYEYRIKKTPKVIKYQAYENPSRKETAKQAGARSNREPCGKCN